MTEQEWYEIKVSNPVKHKLDALITLLDIEPGEYDALLQTLIDREVLDN